MILGPAPQLTQMQAPQGPGAPAYVNPGTPQLPPMMANPAQSSPLVAALIGAGNTTGSQTQTSPMSGLPLGALTQLAGQANKDNGYSSAMNLGLTQLAPSVFSEYSQPVGPGLPGSP